MAPPPSALLSFLLDQFEQLMAKAEFGETAKQMGNNPLSADS